LFTLTRRTDFNTRDISGFPPSALQIMQGMLGPPQ
jgi:hypothetical protein